MMKEMKVAEVMLNYDHGTSDSVTKDVNLDPDTKVAFVEKVSRWTGTDYRDEYYRIIGTNDALVVHRNMYGAGGFYDEAEVMEGCYASRRAYGASCRSAAEAVGCSVELALAVGPELLRELVERVSRANSLSKMDVHELADCGIDRRKAAICRVLRLTDDPVDRPLNGIIRDAGQINSERIANYLLSSLPRLEEQPKKQRPENLTTSLAEVLEAVGLSKLDTPGQQ